MHFPACTFVRGCAGATLALLLSSFGHAADDVPAGWFQWPSVEPRDGSALDASSPLAEPGKLPRITVRDGHFVRADGVRVRFWGCNLTAAQAYPANAQEADAIARVLAKGGVTIARLHHLDNPWGIGKGESIWRADQPGHRDLDAEQLDRLHRLIAALRDHGIYTNLNLKVSKELVPADGFASSVSELPMYQKRADIFDRRMIDLQKEYARKLLTTKNPYTGYAPAEDPAVAVIELNNENSLLGFWTRDLGRGLDKFPEPFRGELQQLWNTWLAQHYASDEALAKAWAPARTGAATASLLPPHVTWKANVNPEASATVVEDGDHATQEVHIAKTAGIDYHVQLSTGGFTVKDGEVYTVELLAKADRSRKIGVGVGVDATVAGRDGWRSFGLLDSVAIGTAWQPVRLTFQAHSVAGDPAVLSINAGQTTGTVWLKDVRLAPDAPNAGLQPGQSFGAGTVPIPTSPSTRQWSDWIHFLADTERAFADEIRAFLKDELHVQAAIACSQIDYGGLTGANRETNMDFADGHAYWQHPDFPGGAWNLETWTIKNTPQLPAFGERSFAELGALALVRVAGKPFTVSEYDHPAPSEFVCEMYPEFASFACRQDWDILYPFAIGAYGAGNPNGTITDFFDQLHHPAKWGLSVFASRMFRDGLVERAPRSAELHLGSPLWAEQPHADILWRKLISGSLDFLNVRYAVSDRPGKPGDFATVVRDGSIAQGGPVRLVNAPRGRLLIIDAPQVAAVTGYIGGFTTNAGALRVSAPRFGRDFATVAAIALDHEPLAQSQRVLITVVGRAQNAGIAWNETRTSVGKTWGHGPAVVEHVPATVTLLGANHRKVFALAPDGTRRQIVASRSTASGLTFTVGADDHTLHYEVVAE